MIYIDPDRCDEKNNNIIPSLAWFRIAAKARKKAIREKKEHKWQVNVYAHDEVKAALEELFHGKCAYCEQSLPEEWDVEHYRPKGGVKENKDHPGYYWLGYEWTNLYPSCKHCNQKRKDRRLHDDPTTLPAAGKADHFPLYDERTRAKSPEANILDEHTLLIDPCYDDPSDYLGFDPLGFVFALESNPYGKKSIELYNLNRRRLVKRRIKRMKWVVQTLRMIKRAKKECISKNLIAELEEQLDDITSDSASFAGAARYLTANKSTFWE